MNRLRAIMRARGEGSARWAAEVAGMAALAAGAWLAWEPAGFMLIGGYLVLLANSGRGNGGRA